MLRIGDWRVDPNSGHISRNGETARMDERTMRLLLCLAGHAGEVVSIDDLLNQVWSGVTVTPDSVYQAVATLRRQLGDDPKQPTYIATVPRLGYRMVAKVSPWAEQSVASSPVPRRRAGIVLAAVAVLALALAAAFIFRGKAANNHRAASIAVLPFLDLTEEMNHGPFADGMTEELIDKLSKIPGLGTASHVLVLFQGQANTGRRYRQVAGCGLLTRRERAQVRRAATRRRALDSCRQRVCCLVGNLRPVIGRYPDGPGRHSRRSDQGAEGVHRGQAVAAKGRFTSTGWASHGSSDSDFPKTRDK